jgi:magnesium chelatase family protein
VLFLDELAEFDRATLDALRQPLEDGTVAIARSGGASVHPARFMLLAATNPCPCGWAGDERCTCVEPELARHRRRLSGPLLDRIDMLVFLESAARTGLDAPPLTSSKRARAQVHDARARQQRRAGPGQEYLNATIPPHALRLHARLDRRGASLLHDAARSGMLSARGAERALRVARTIADLEGSERVEATHVGGALAMRSTTAPWAAAAQRRPRLRAVGP